MDEHRQSGEVGRQGTNWRGWAMLVLVVLLIVFVVQNSQEVKIDFLFFTSVTTPLILALVFSALLGALIGWLAPRVRRRDD
ncbi:MAG TPA: LapA family protein [Solirubrobacterales bacterium]|nr:LapA family protein [Solirubrobacterales bacterium]